MSTHDIAFAQLSRLAHANNMDEAAFQAVLYSLSAQQRRFFLALCKRSEISTVEARSGCSLGNPSAIASTLNEKLAAAGDQRRVRCELREHVNAHGEVGQLGHWRLVRTEEPAAVA